jgi:Nop14-like family
VKKSGGVIDRRFGENEGIDPEERMLERFTREKQVFLWIMGVIVETDS